MSNCLVTGGAGFIGSVLVRQLKEKGHKVYVYDRKIGTKWSDIPDVDIVFHFAAQTDVEYSLTHAHEDASDNIMLTLEVLERYPNVRILYPASAASLDIKSPYGLSKKVAADYIKLMHPDHVIITLPNIWGPGGKGAINKFEKVDVMTIFGDGEQTRTIVHVEDVARSFVLGMEWERGEYSLGGEVVSINEIARRMNKPKVYKPQHSGHIFASVIENTTPNWQPEIMLPDLSHETTAS